jgi:hypothetical protein
MRTGPAPLVERLRRQRLTTDSLPRAEDVVSWLGAVQSQDFHGAKWALAVRAAGVTEAAVNAAFDAGRILRTHVLRPTWHFVAPADIRWMIALTGPRVQKANLAWGGRLGVPTRTFTKAISVIASALEGGRHLTRHELANALKRARIDASGSTLAHLVMGAELEGVVCSGPRRGKQFTYALLSERAPDARVLPKDEALAELARRYVASRAPATVEDFTWWSGLTLTAARAAVASAGVETLSVPPPAAAARGAHFLLPNFDEYLIAYKHRGAIVDDHRARNLGIYSSDVLPHHVIVDGREAGRWQREIGARTVSLTMVLHTRLARAARAGLRAEAAKYTAFLGLDLADVIVKEP